MLYDISSIYDTGTKYTLGAFNCDIIVQYNNYVYSSTLSLSSISLTAWNTCKLIYFTLTCINVLYISTVCKFVPSWLLGILIHFFKLFENSNKIILLTTKFHKHINYVFVDCWDGANKTIWKWHFLLVCWHIGITL